MVLCIIVWVFIGMDLWKGKQVHSHIYRVPDPFRDEVVVVVGSFISGLDISMELVKVAKEVHLSAKSLDVPPGVSKVISKHQNLHLHPQIESLEEDGRVIFTDGSCIVADTILYCTGVEYEHNRDVGSKIRKLESSISSLGNDFIKIQKRKSELMEITEKAAI